MGEVTTIGLDIAKNVFQVHGVDASGTVVLRKRLSRARVLGFFADLPRCVVGMETCSGAHHWARELCRLGHDARVMPAKYVKPYVKTNKTDARDAAAICEAVSRPEMRFVPVKSVEQQAVLVLHRTREILGRQRVMLINALRAHCAEFGIIVPQGARHVPELVARLDDPSDERLPDIAKQARVQGVLILECTISPQGRVTDVKVLRGIPLLDEAAKEAVRQWVYTPTLLNGVPVPVIMTVTVNFRLQ